MPTSTFDGRSSGTCRPTRRAMSPPSRPNSKPWTACVWPRYSTAVSRGVGRYLDVYVQVNTSAEESKYGLEPADVPAFLAALPRYTALRVRGFMTLALFTADTPPRVRECFRLLRTLRDRARDADPALIGPGGTVDGHVRRLRGCHRGRRGLCSCGSGDLRSSSHRERPLLAHVHGVTIASTDRAIDVRAGSVDARHLRKPDRRTGRPRPPVDDPELDRTRCVAPDARCGECGGHGDVRNTDISRRSTAGSCRPRSRSVLGRPT